MYRQAVSAIEDELHEYENLLNMFGIASRFFVVVFLVILDSFLDDKFSTSLHFDG